MCANTYLTLITLNPNIQFQSDARIVKE